MDKMGNEPLLLTVMDAVRLLNVSKSKIYDLIGKGEIMSLKVGRVRRIPRTALEQYIERKISHRPH
jgi:excisionase family DNA binding protein